MLQDICSQGYEECTNAVLLVTVTAAREIPGGLDGAGIMSGRHLLLRTVGITELLESLRSTG